MTITSRGAVAPVADQVGVAGTTTAATRASVDAATLDATVNLVADHAPGWATTGAADRA